MTSDMITLLVAVVLLFGAWWLWTSASRLDRLHRKVATSRAVVDAQLLRRASAAANLAASGLMDPVSSMLVGEAAWSAIAAGSDAAEAAARFPVVAGAASPGDRGIGESELSATLRGALDDEDEVDSMREEPGGAEIVDAVADAWYRAQLARRFHNEAVLQTQRVRRGWPARTLRLAGRAPAPETLELDDAWPKALGRPGRPTTPAGQTGTTV